MRGDQKIPLSRKKKKQGVRPASEQISAPRKQFGRDPTTDERMFVDSKPDETQFVSESQMDLIQSRISEMMAAAGLDPAFIYAARKTGRIVTEYNMQFLSPADLEEWNQAVEEYERLAAANRA